MDGWIEFKANDALQRDIRFVQSWAFLNQKKGTKKFTHLVYD